MKHSLFRYTLMVVLSLCIATALFAAPTSTGKAHAAPTHIRTHASNCPSITYSFGKTWRPGDADSTTACSGRTLVLTYQSFDNNFVLYCQGYSAIWATGTNNSDTTDFQPVNVVFQPDGNLVLYEYSVGLGAKMAFWASGTNGRGATRLVLQGDANLVIYNGSNQAIWASNTSGRC